MLRTLRRPRLLLVEVQVKAMQEVMNGRRQQHRDHRQEKHSAEQGVRNREDLRRWSGDWIHRTHAGENHRRIQSRIQPRQAVEHVVADGAYSQRGKDEHSDDSRVLHKPMNERAAQDASRQLRHVDEYRTPCERCNTRVPQTTLAIGVNDDNLRWQTYYAIYRDPFLSRYAPGGGLLWGHRHPFRGGGMFPLGPTRFPGTEPAGDYPIHIIVKQGRITLLGVVDNESDKTVAGMRARGVPGSFGVENELVVDHPATSKSTP